MNPNATVISNAVLVFPHSAVQELFAALSVEHALVWAGYARYLEERLAGYPLKSLEWRVADETMRELAAVYLMNTVDGETLQQAYGAFTQRYVAALDAALRQLADYQQYVSAIRALPPSKLDGGPYLLEVKGQPVQALYTFSALTLEDDHDLTG